MELHSRVSRLPIPLTELEGYLVDSHGQVWRHGDARGGRDRALKGMPIHRAARDWAGLSMRHGQSPRQLAPGAWRWIPGLAHFHPRWWSASGGHHDDPSLDVYEYLAKHAVGDADEREPAWGAWGQAEDEAAKKCREESEVWFLIRPRREPHNPTRCEIRITDDIRQKMLTTMDNLSDAHPNQPGVETQIEELLARPCLHLAQPGSPILIAGPVLFAWVNRLASCT